MLKVIIDKDKIDNLLTRGVDKIYPSKEALEKLLISGKKIKLYQGFDPTGNKLHIGHMVGLRKHRQWQDMGHEVIFLIGDGTGQAGDPSGKKQTREKFFTQKELLANSKSYLKQASKVVRFTGPNPIKIMYNSKWLNKLKLVDILDLAQNFSLQQLIERDMFQERLRNSETINMREFLYPLLQGYDSVAMGVDLELGGTDQTFNMLTGRTLMRNMKGKEKFVMTTPLLSDSKGIKIGKSEGNVIGLTDEPEDLFGKIMSLGDDAIIPLFTLLTDTPMEEINNFNISKDAMPLKKRVARLIVASLNSDASADHAQEFWENTFQKNEIPKDVSSVEVKEGALLVDIFLSNKIISSKNDFRRLVDEGAITNLDTKEKVTSYDASANTGVYRVGKKRFLKIIIK